MYIDYIVCIFIYILHQSEKLIKSIGILSHLVETDIGGKGKDPLLVETCYAPVNYPVLRVRVPRQRCDGY
jgi:hypothetical protein